MPACGANNTREGKFILKVSTKPTTRFIRLIRLNWQRQKLTHTHTQTKQQHATRSTKNKNNKDRKARQKTHSHLFIRYSIGQATQRQYKTMSSISTSSSEITDSQRRRSRGSRCCSYFVPFMGFCNTIGLVGMGMMIAFLFVQLQYVSYRLNAEEKATAQLKLQVQNQTEGQIQELVTQVEQQKDYTVYQLAGTFTLLTCLLTTFHMVSHLRKLNEPFIQRKIMAILWMSPIYSLTSFTSLLLPKSEGYLSIIKDFYEA